jgi:hypothetical protein
MRTQDAQNWPDEGVVRAKVGQEGRRREHYVILEEISGAVVAAPPDGIAASLHTGAKM